MINGLPLPANEPPQELLNQESTEPEPPVAVKVIVPLSSEQKPDLSTVIPEGACAVDESIISNGLLSVPVITGLLLITRNL